MKPSIGHFFWDSFWHFLAVSFEKLLAGSIGAAFLGPAAGGVWCLWGMQSLIGRCRQMVLPAHGSPAKVGAAS